MIVTGGPTLDEKLKKVTPWWDVLTKYLIAAMMAIALTSIAVQLTNDNLICVPAIECSNLTNSSDDATKLCQSLGPKSLKKKVLAKMVDRRFYDYLDSVCFQQLSWFTKFFPLILLVEAVLLLVFDILWTTLPFSSSVLNHFVSLTEEGYSSLATIDIIIKRGLSKQGEERNRDDAITEQNLQPDIRHDSNSFPLLPRDQKEREGSGHTGNETLPSTSIQAAYPQKRFNIPDADALKVLNLIEKAEHFRKKYTKKECVDLRLVSRDIECDSKKSPSLYCFYLMRTISQFITCAISFGVNIWDHKNVFSFSNTVHFKCLIDDILFTKEYEHFECSHPLAPYFQIALILFLISLGFHFLISGWAFRKMLCCGRSYTYPKNTDLGSAIASEHNNDFAFLFYLLEKHDKLYADRVSYFFRHETYEALPGNILNYMSKKEDNTTGANPASQ